MQIYLLRHGEADSAEPDERRSLTVQGRRAVTAVLTQAHRAGLAPDVILVSPLVRALETAALAAEICRPGAAVMQSKALAPHADPREAWEELRVHRDAAQVLLAGHQPLLGSLVAFLTRGGEVKMPTAALARVDIEQLGTQPRGVLRWLLPPELV